MAVRDSHPFALCLTHDVDRVYKTYQSFYYAAAERDPGHLADLLPGRNPYWQFPDIMDLEDDLGVRSSFNFLDEQYLFQDKPARAWVRPDYWRLFLGRYEIDDEAVVDAIRELDAGGWEIGLHGSFESFRDEARLRQEKATLEDLVGHEVIGGRQHYLNLDRPRTWRYQRDVGLSYDSSLGSSRIVGFQGRYEPFRPFGDEFVVFPLTLMDCALPNVDSHPDRAWRTCERLLEEARDNNGVMTVLWHPCQFSEPDYPNFETLYERLIERALEMGAWVGPPGELYERLDRGTLPVPSRQGERREPTTVHRVDRSAPTAEDGGSR